MAKLNRADTNVLNALSTSPHGWTPTDRLPNGHGYTGKVRGETLHRLKHAGLICYGKDPKHSLYGWRITDAGLEALAPSPTPSVTQEEADER